MIEETTKSTSCFALALFLFDRIVAWITALCNISLLTYCDRVWVNIKLPSIKGRALPLLFIRTLASPFSCHFSQPPQAPRDSAFEWSLWSKLRWENTLFTNNQSHNCICNLVHQQLNKQSTQVSAVNLSAASKVIRISSSQSGCDIMCYHSHRLLLNLLIISSIHCCLSQYVPLSPVSSQCWRGQAENCMQRVKEIAQSMPSTVSSSVIDPSPSGSPVLGTTRVSEKCDLMRGSLRCILDISGPCFQFGGMKFEDALFLASTFLRRFCDSSSHWSRMFCYTNEAMRSCETIMPRESVSQMNASSVCPHYYKYFSCAMERIATCPLEDQTHQAVYFLDKSKDAAWQCGLHPNTVRYPSSTGYDNNAFDGIFRPSYLQPNQNAGYQNIGTSGSGNIYGSPPLSPNYGSNNLYPPNQPSSLSPATGSIYPNSYPYNQADGRPFPDNQFSIFPGDSCIDKASTYARNYCENEFYRRKADVQNARTAYDQKRRSCCSLHALQDCLRRQISSICRSEVITSNTIDMLMGPSRSSELTMTCQDHPSYYCNSVNLIYISPLLFIINALVSFFYRHSQV